MSEDDAEKSPEEAQGQVSNTENQVEASNNNEAENDPAINSQAIELLSKLRKFASDPALDLKSKINNYVTPTDKDISYYKKSMGKQVQPVETTDQDERLNRTKFAVLEAEKKSNLSPKIFQLNSESSQMASKTKHLKKSGLSSVAKSKSVVSTVSN
jgi:hypothetical protein